MVSLSLGLPGGMPEEAVTGDWLRQEPGLGGGRLGAESSQAEPSRVEPGRVEPRVEPGIENLGGFVLRTDVGRVYRSDALLMDVWNISALSLMWQFGCCRSVC